MLASPPFHGPEGSAVTFARNNNTPDLCPVFNIIICQNHINLMYDKWIKWIHLGLQEASFINAGIYSHDFNATIPPLVKHRTAVRFLWCCWRKHLFSVIVKRGGRNLALSPGPCGPWLAPLTIPLLLEKRGKNTKTEYLHRNPTGLINFLR